ncbi:MAG TPA: YggS family pyridoxal phosphate-dependent enzyme [Chloroflexi bacterium]|nr:YggS family pyridoxal phosphate-dependent enzyme [Chloroflexota bacterium]
MARKAEAAAAQLGVDSGIVWHQIGPVQSRKTKLVAQHADVLHALDRLKIANRLSRQLANTGKILPVFLEVNLSGEASKAGFPCANWEEDATQQAELRKVVEHVTNLPGLSLYGLMTMAPWRVEEAIIRAVFRRTRLLAKWLEQTTPSIQEPLHLSMGMTDDFEIAIEEGATHVRVGRAIFGERDYSN